MCAPLALAWRVPRIVRWSAWIFSGTRPAQFEAPGGLRAWRAFTATSHFACTSPSEWKQTFHLVHIHLPCLSWCRRRSKEQLDHECDAALRIIADMQSTRELFDNTVVDGQSQPGSLADLLESAPALAGSNMAAIFALKCSSCDEIHEGSPSFAFRAPDPFLKQAKAVQDAGKLGSDLCWYDDEDGRHFFVQACLEVPIHGVSEPFTWRVWASLSEASFNRYGESYDSPDPSDAYFG